MGWEVPGWEFSVEEVSQSHYRVIGKGPRGMTVERDGSDDAEVMRSAARDAAELNRRAGLFPTGEPRSTS